MRYLLGFFYLILLSFSLPVHASVFSSYEIQALLADAGQDQAICADFALIQGSDPGLAVGLWTVLEGSGLVDSPNSPSAQVSNLSPGLNKLVWEYYDGALLLESDTLEIIRFLPPIASAGLDFSACAGDLISMSASALLPLESGIWQSIGHSENVSSPLLSNSLLSISIPGSYAFEWTVTNLICPIASDTVIVEIIAPPTAPEAGVEQTICTSSTVLLANEPILGETGTWTVIEGSGIFSDQNSASSSVSGLSAGNNILRWTISNAYCAAVSDDVLIIVETAPTAEAGIDQTTCSSSATLNATAATGGIWSTLSGSGIFADASNASSEVIGLSVGNNVFRWTVSGGSCGEVFDEVIITVDENPTTALAGDVQSICSTSSALAANSPTVGSGIWSLVSGSGSFTDSNDPNTTVTGLSIGNNIFQWTISNGVCFSSSDQVTIAVDVAPITPNAGNDQTTCSSSATLNATSATGGIWSIVSGPGIFVDASNASSEVSGLLVGNNVFRWTVSGGSCGEVFDEVIITVDENPTTALAGEDQSICSTSSALAANSPTVGSGIWSLVSGSGSFTDSNDPNTSVTGLSIGNNIFQWTISNGTCSSSSDQVIISVDAAPITPDAGQDQTICTFNTVLSAFTATGGSWSVVSGTGTFANAALANSSVSGLSVGPNVIRWTIPGGVCGSVSDDVTITVQAQPTTALAGSDQIICATVTTLDGSAPTVGNGVWTVISGAGTFANANLANSSVSGLSTGTNVLRWTISNGVCTPSFDEVSINVDANPITPNAGSDQNICNNSTTLAATAATGGSWSVISGTGTLLNAALPNSNVTGLSVGNNIFRWTIPGGACGSVSDDVTITVQAQPSTALAGSDQIICATVTTLDGSAPTVGNGVWTVISGAGAFANANLANSSVSGLSTGTNVLRWTISNGVCTPSFDEVSINVDANPITPNAGSDQNICNNSTNLAATAATGGSWSVVSGTGTFANASLANTNITGLSVGNNVFRWTIPGGACGSVSDDVTINVQAQPSTALAGSDQNICATVTSLNGNVPTIGNGVWTVISGAGAFANANLANSSVSGLSTGTNVLRWTISNGVCTPSFDEVSINVDANPITPNAGSDQNICNNSTNLAATAATGGSWSVVSGTGTFANASLANTNITGLSVGNNVFRWTIPGGACGSVSDDVTINVQAQPSTALAGSDQNICATVTSLNGNVPTIGNGVWTVISGAGTFANANLSNSSISGLSTGTNVLRWTITNGVCTPSFDEVSINVDANPITPNAGIDQNICNNSTTLAATAATGGTWSVVSGTGTFTNTSLANTNVTGLSIGNNVFRWTIPGGACGSVSDDVNITVQAQPSTALAGTDQIICASVTSLNGNVPAVGNGVWTVISGAGTFANANLSNSSISGLSTGTNVLRWTITNGVCTPSFDEVSINVDANPITPNAGIDQNICNNSTTLAATAATGGTWSVVSGTGTFTNTSLANTNVTGLSIGNNVFRWTIPGGACGSVSDDVTITVQAQPSTALAGSDQNICATVTSLNGNVPTIGNGLWTIISGAGTFANANLANSSVFGLSTGTNVFRWAISNGVCAPSFDEVSINVDANPITPNAGSDQNICNNSTTLAATAATGGSWSVVSGTGTILNAALPNTNVTGLSVGSNVFRWTIPGGACGSVSDDVTITVQAQPSTALAGSDQIICATVTSLNGNVPVVGNGVWTVISGAGAFANANLANSSVSGLSTGTNVLRWTISNGVCAPSFDEVSINVDANPITPNAGSDQNICTPITNLNASAAAGGIWTVVSGSGIFANSNLESTSVSGLSLGANVFRWTIDGGTCLDLSDEVIITVNQAPSSALAGQDQTICATTTSLNGNSPLLGSGVWTVVSGTAIFSNENQTNSSVSGLSVGQNILRWSISNGVCTPSIDEVSITVQTAPSLSIAGNDQSVCSNSTQLSANTPTTGIGTWSVVSGSGTFVNAANPQTQVTGLGSGINVFRWTITNGFCQPSIDEVSVLSFQNPTIALAGPDAIVCNSGQTLSANTPVVGTGTWAVVSGSANIQSPNNPSTTISGLSLGNVVLSWTISNGACPASIDNVVLQVFATPISIAGTDQSVCTTSATLNASAAGSGNTGVWSLLSGNGIIQNPNNPNSTVSNLGLGANVFRWSVTNGACPEAVSQVTITRTAAPSQAVAGTDLQTCATSAILTAVIPTVGSGFWSVLLGSGLIDNPSSPSTAINGLAPGLNQLIWSVSSGTCPSTSDTVDILVDQNPTSANAGSDQQVCSTLSNFEATAPIVGIGVWTVVSGTGAIAQINNASSQISNLSVGTNVFRWTVTNGSCVTFDEVTITRFLSPTVSTAGSDQTICASSVQLTGNNPSIGIGSWSIITGFGTIANSAAGSTGVSNLAPGANVFRWTISNGACSASSDEVTVIREIPPSPALAGTDEEVCGSIISLSATAPISGNGIWSLISGSGTLTSPQNAITTVSDLGIGANIFQWTTLSGNCTASTDQVTITRFDNPSNADAGIDISICGNSVVLSAQEPLVGVGQWSIIAGNGTIVNPTANNSAIEDISEGLLFLNWTVSNGVCPASSDQMIVNAQSLTFIAYAGPDQEFCGNVAEINGSEPGTANALWTFLNGEGAFDQPQFPSVLAFTTFNGPQLIEYSISNGACVSRDTMVLTTWQALSPVSAGLDTSLCNDAYFLIGSAEDFATLNWSTASAIIESPNNDSTAVSSLLSGQNSFTLTASNGTCPTQTDEVIVTFLAPSTPPSVMEDAFLCSDSIQISATPDGGEWSIVGPFGSIENPTDSSTNLTNVSLGSTEVVYTIALGNCISSDTLRIVRSESPAFADAGPDQQICGQEAILAGNIPDVGIGTWIFIDNLAEISNVNDVNASLFAEEPGLRAMAWSITNNFCTVSDTVEMIFLETPVANGGPNIITCLNDTAFLQAEIPNFGISYWNLITNNATIEDSLFQNTSLTPVETGNAYLWWTVSNGACRDSDLVVITILSPDDPECLANEPAVFIPEGFSPNGDGKFDQFVITGPSIKAIRLQVFDRWGNLVYENQNYQNDWSGFANQGSVLNGSQLAEGTYYYLVDVEGESESRRGYFTLWR